MDTFTIGIAGGSGSGKTTMCLQIIDALPDISVALLQYDAYYKELPHLSFEERARMNFDHPDALDNERCIEQLRSLKSGHIIEQPIYDFSTHLRKKETRRIKPAPLILLEGILIFTDSSLRGECDLRIFLDAEDTLRFERRMHRDVHERGRSIDSVVRQYSETVRPMFEQFVLPSRSSAHHIISLQAGDDIPIAFVMNTIHSRFGL